MTRILAVLLALAAIVFYVTMIVDAVTNKGMTDTERLMWVLVVILVTPGFPLGALIYFFYGRPKRRLAV